MRHRRENADIWITLLKNCLHVLNMSCYGTYTFWSSSEDDIDVPFSLLTQRFFSAIKTVGLVSKLSNNKKKRGF